VTLAFPSQAESAGTGTRYDVMAGALEAVSSFGPQAGDLCVASGTAATEVADTTPVPAVGHGAFFLARARNACGTSRWETASDGRDRSVTACP
jgi:hypothetical protein